MIRVYSSKEIRLIQSICHELIFLAIKKWHIYLQIFQQSMFFLVHHIILLPEIKSKLFAQKRTNSFSLIKPKVLLKGSRTTWYSELGPQHPPVDIYYFHLVMTQHNLLWSFWDYQLVHNKYLGKLEVFARILEVVPINLSHKHLSYSSMHIKNIQICIGAIEIYSTFNLKYTEIMEAYFLILCLTIDT